MILGQSAIQRGHQTLSGSFFRTVMTHGCDTLSSSTARDEGTAIFSFAVRILLNYGENLAIELHLRALAHFAIEFLESEDFSDLAEASLVEVLSGCSTQILVNVSFNQGID
jgi:hypothetical protein